MHAECRKCAVQSVHVIIWWNSFVHTNRFLCTHYFKQANTCQQLQRKSQSTSKSEYYDLTKMCASLKKTKNSITWLSTDWILCTSPPLDWFRRLAAAIDITTNTLELPSLTTYFRAIYQPTSRERLFFGHSQNPYFSSFSCSQSTLHRDIALNGGLPLKKVSWENSLVKHERPNAHSQPHLQKIKSMYQVGPYQIWVPELHTSQIKLNINQCF